MNEIEKKKTYKTSSKNLYPLFETYAGKIFQHFHLEITFDLPQLICFVPVRLFFLNIFLYFKIFYFDI